MKNYLKEDTLQRSNIEKWTISLLPAIFKILENLINNRLVLYLEKQSLLSKTPLNA